MDNFSFHISDNGKCILRERCHMDFDEDSEQPEFIEHVRLLRHPLKPVLHLIAGSRLVASVSMEPTTFWQNRRSGFRGDLDTNELRISVRMCKLGHRIYGVMVLVSKLAPLQDISDVLAKSGIESALDAV